jgi:hypothetical protein
MALGMAERAGIAPAMAGTCQDEMGWDVIK